LIINNWAISFVSFSYIATGKLLYSFALFLGWLSKLLLISACHITVAWDK
jgi:hypothetical protein